ncbi:hypothetical protein ACPW96_18140 [Micromonospora sp. DT81.3]|uniref:hypothetical protein n=1 Tax=Micromonospora sp. DT81.3 TaxID=3416523 RepID=UPI003CE7A9D8
MGFVGRATKLLLGVMLIGFIALVSEPVGADHEPVKTEPTRAPRTASRALFSVLAALLLTAGLAAAGYFLWTEYERSEPPLTERPDIGAINVYFDTPGVDAALEVAVNSNPYNSESLDVASDNIDVSLVVRGEAAQQVRFTLVLSGSAYPQTLYPAGIPRELEAGCFRGSVHGIDIECQGLLADPSGMAPPGKDTVPVYVITGVTSPAFKDGPQSARVTLEGEGETVVETAEQRIFQLPEVGTRFIPLEFREATSFDLASGARVFVPVQLTSVMTYDTLESTEVVEGVQPEPLSRAPLTWVSSANQAPSGTVIDLREERSRDRNVFVLGVLAGVIGGLVPAALLLWSRVFLPAK